MTSSNLTSNLPKINIGSLRNNRKILLYIVFGISAIAIIMLVVMIIWFATKDNPTNPSGNPTVTNTPGPNVSVEPTTISDIPVVESTSFIYLEKSNGNSTGNIFSYDLKTDKKEKISTVGNIKKIISISPNNKYLFLQTSSNSGKDEYGIFTLENKSYDIINISSFVQSFWASNDFLDYLYEKNSNFTYSVETFNVRDKTQTLVLSFPKNLVSSPLVSRDLKYLVGIDPNDDSYHYLNLGAKTNQTIESLGLSSGSYFIPLLWNNENRLIYSSDSGIYKFNPVTLTSSLLVSLSTTSNKLEILFPSYNEDQKSMLFMVDGYIYRFNINTSITKEVLNINNRSNLRLVDIEGNGQNFFLMENYNGMLEAYNIKNSKLVTICTDSCNNPVWYN